MQELQQFASGIAMICVIIMRGIGVIDNVFTRLMQWFGVYDMHWQLCILLAVLVFYVVLSLRAVGGMLGWAMLFFAVLVLLHRTVPAFSSPGIPVATQFSNSL